MYPEVYYVIVPKVTEPMSSTTISVLNVSSLPHLSQHLLLLLFSLLAILTGFLVLIFGQVCYDKEHFPQDPDDKLIICLPMGSLVLIVPNVRGTMKIPGRGVSIRHV